MTAPTTYTTERKIEVLRAAAGIIRKAGLAKHSYRDDQPNLAPQDCPHCAMGGILEVLVPNFGMRKDIAVSSSPEFYDLLRDIAATLCGDRPTDWESYDIIASYNDIPQRTEEEVAALLDNTAARLEVAA